MARFIALLRGINVGGHRKIRMVELRQAYESLGFDRVESYLQSGNVIFDSKRRGAAAIIGIIEREIASRFGHDVTVILRTAAELAAIVEDSPFTRRPTVDPAHLAVLFLAKAPRPSSSLDSIESSHGNDSFVPVGREIHLHYPGGAARTRFTTDFFERRLKVRATARNWRTVNALLRIASDR